MTKSKRYASVWGAIETDSVAAENLKLRSMLMMEIDRYFEASNLTQSEAAKRMHTTQPRLNDVLQGKIEKCTIDRLVNMLAAVGRQVSMRVSDAA